MSAEQRRLALALLRSSSSPAGYRKALDIMALQGVLQRMTAGVSDPFDPDLYYVSVFGTPGARAWGWRLEGHHLSRHFTVVGRDTRRRAVLPRRLADPRRERVSLGRAGLPDDAA